MGQPLIQSVFCDAVGGDPYALSALRHECHRMLVRYLRPQVAGRAEEMAHAAWSEAVTQLNEFKGDDRGFRMLLLRRADEQIGNGSRSPRTVASAAPARQVIDLRSAETDEEPVPDAAIAGLLRGLSPHQAHILLLRVVGGLSAEETAGLLRQTPATIRLTEHEALQQIAHRLRQEQSTAVRTAEQGERVLARPAHSN